MIFQEGVLIAVIGYVLGLILSRVGLLVISGMLKTDYPYDFSGSTLLLEEGYLLLVTMVIGFMAALIPAIHVVKINLSKTLADA